MAKNMGTLGKYEQIRLCKCICIVNWVDWKLLIIALMVEKGIFTALANFLKPLNSFVKLNYVLLHIRNIFFGFYYCYGWLREFELCFPFYLYFPDTGSLAG